MKALSVIGVLVAALTPCLHAGTITEYFQGRVIGAYVDGVDPGGIYDASRGSMVFGSFSFDLTSGSGCTYLSGSSGAACLYTLPVTITVNDETGSKTVVGTNLNGVEGSVELEHGIQSLNPIEWVGIAAKDGITHAGIIFKLPNGTLTDVTAFPWGTQTVIPIDPSINSGQVFIYNPVSSGVYSYGDLQFTIDSVSLSPMSVVASPEPATFALVGVLFVALINFNRARSGSQRHLGTSS
jgi:hypothetical protein